LAIEVVSHVVPVRGGKYIASGGAVLGVSELQPNNKNRISSLVIIFVIEWFLIFRWIKSRENSLMSFVIFLLFEFFKSNFVTIKRCFGLTKSLALMEAASPDLEKQGFF
jgi:hypothetical protein